VTENRGVFDSGFEGGFVLSEDVLQDFLEFFVFGVQLFHLYVIGLFVGLFGLVEGELEKLVVEVFRLFIGEELGFWRLKIRILTDVG
jgi:uncharacterized membrane protein (DUF373 family)